MIVYSYITFRNPLPERQFRSLLNHVPTGIQARIMRYRRWQDQHNALFGKLLLARLIKLLGHSESRLLQIKENVYGKPILGPDIDFNISHSDTLVACVVSDKQLVGIDVEKKTSIHPETIRSFLRPEEWKFLTRNLSPETFFDFWTKKESLLKAKGMGLNIDLRNVHVQENKGVLWLGGRSETWYYYSLPIPGNFTANLCTQQPGLPLQFVTAQDLLNTYFQSSTLELCV